MITEIKNWLISLIDPLTNRFLASWESVASKVLMALLVLIVDAIAIRILEKTLRKVVNHWASEKTLLGIFVVSVSTKVAWIVLAIIVISQLGVNVAPLIAGIGATGFIVGFACQESLGSLAAGIMIAVNQPFKIGDFVNIDGNEGVVKHLDMMAVTLVTGDNRRITIPNKQAWGSAIINNSALPLRRIEVDMDVSYDTNLVKACEVALMALAGVPGVLKNPAPNSLIMGQSDSAVNLVFRAWVKNSDYWPVKSEATRLVMEAFDREGIVMPYPHMDVHMID